MKQGHPKCKLIWYRFRSCQFFMMILLKEEKVCDGTYDCIDRSDELCSDHCAPKFLYGNYTMKVRMSLSSFDW